MGNNKLVYFDGRKSGVLWDETSDAWTYLNDPPKSEIQTRYRLVPTLFRAVEMNANAVATMPFKVLRGKDQIDSSQDYANKLGYLSDPRRLFSLLSMSLDLAGRAYVRNVRNAAGYGKDLFYFAPFTVEPEYNERGQLASFKRRVNNREEPLKLTDLLYFWLPDPYVEVGPPLSWPAQAALASANVLGNLDTFVAMYFERGAVRPMIVSVKGTPSPVERERMEAWFTKLWSGIKKAFSLKVFEADAVTVQSVGDGLDQLRDVELTEQKCKDIAKALGIPYALLFSEAANYATAQVDTLNWYKQTVEPRCEFIAATINAQLLRAQGMSIEFQPETLDIYQTDETERADALVKYTQVGFPLLMACDLLGVELTEEQRAELEKAEREKEVRAEEMDKLREQQPAAQDGENPPPNGAPQNGSQPPAKQPAPEVRAELERWRRKALNYVKRNKSLVTLEFESDIIPADESARIASALATCKTAADVCAAFEDQPKDVTAIVEAIRLGVEALKVEPAAAK